MFIPFSFSKRQYKVSAKILFAIIFEVGILANASGTPARPLPPPCGEWHMRNGVVPKDYRYPDKRLGVVEEYHFGPLVEALVCLIQVGMTFGADLNYTLFAYPNHHRALVTLMRLVEREGTEQPKGSRFTIDCFFQRATAWAPDDLVARMLYAKYLISSKRRGEAIAQLKIVTENAGNNPLTHYNAGLLYLELGEYREASTHAERAANLGDTRTDLITELRRRGALSHEISLPGAKGPQDATKAAEEDEGEKDRSGQIK